MKRQITYEWWPEGNKRGEVDTGHIDALEEHSVDFIPAQIFEGFTSGQLLQEVEGKQYQGYWELTTLA